MFGINQVKDIAQGWTNYALGKEEELSESRMKICKECPLYNEKTDRCDSSRWYNPKTGEVSWEIHSGWISGCNCFMKKKTRVPTAKCVLGKWDK